MTASNQNPPESRSRSFHVEFYPAIDDYVHVATRLNRAVSDNHFYTLSWYIFVLVNVISFPAYLFISGHVAAGALIFGVNVLFLIFFPSGRNKLTYQKFYSELIGDREKSIATVELSDEGLLYAHDNAETFYRWNKFTLIEDSEDSIFFYYQGHGFGVRKSGFAYLDQQSEFLDFAKSRLASTQQRSPHP